MRNSVRTVIGVSVIMGMVTLVSAQTPDVPAFPTPDPAFISDIPVVPSAQSEWKLPPPLPPVGDEQTVTRQRPVDLVDSGEITDSNAVVPSETSDPVTLEVPELPPFEEIVPPQLSVMEENSASSPAELVGEELWRGSVADERLLMMVPPDGVIRSEAAWRLLWKYWGGGVAAPGYDPTAQIALVATVPRRKAIGSPLIWPDGRVEFAVRGTTEECVGFGYQMALISADGVRRINGKTYQKEPMEWVCGEVCIPSELTTFTGAKITVSLYRTEGRTSDLPAKRIAVCGVEAVSHEQRSGDKMYGFGLGTGERVRPGATYYVVFSIESETYRVRQLCGVGREWVIEWAP